MSGETATDTAAAVPAAAPASPAAAAPASSSSPSASVERVCDYYLSARGCVKGASCDYQHPLAPSGAVTNRICDFFSTPRGCVKGDRCDFLHPRRLNPRGEPCTRVCEFYITPQGCLKGNQCDHLHPRALPAQHLNAAAAGGAGRGAGGGAGRGRGGGMAAAAAGGGVTVRVCEFYLTPAGCNRGDNCQFLHPTGRAAQQALAAKEAAAMGGAGRGGGGQPICDYFFSRKGCSKGEHCPFSHHRDVAASAFPAPYGGYAQYGAAGAVVKKPKVCAYYGTERGCVKGDSCDHIHVNSKPCDFFLSERGCKKGEYWCDTQTTHSHRIPLHWRPPHLPSPHLLFPSFCVSLTATSRTPRTRSRHCSSELGRERRRGGALYRLCPSCRAGRRLHCCCGVDDQCEWLSGQRADCGQTMVAEGERGCVYTALDGFHSLPSSAEQRC